MQRDVAAFERAHPVFAAQVTIAMSSSVCAAGLSDLFFFPGLDPTLFPGRDPPRSARL